MDTDAGYRLLVDGEEIMPGDEYYGNDRRWSPSRRAGKGNRVTLATFGIYRRPITDTPTAPTQEPERKDSMTVYRVAIVYTPSALDVQKGETESFVMPTAEVLAETKEQAIAVAVLENSDKLKAIQGKPSARWSVKTVACYQ